MGEPWYLLFKIPKSQALCIQAQLCIATPQPAFRRLRSRGAWRSGAPCLAQCLIISTLEGEGASRSKSPSGRLVPAGPKRLQHIVDSVCKRVDRPCPCACVRYIAVGEGANLLFELGEG